MSGAVSGFLAPAGTRLTFGDIAAGTSLGLGGAAATRALEEKLAGIAGVRSAWSFVSGRAAMTIAFGVLARITGPERNQVIVPAYTCYSVPAAVERAGLVPVPCDVDPDTLSPDFAHLERLARGPVAAIVTANLFGIPNELAEIESLARRQSIRLLDDAAQALGARLGGRAAGAFGDLGLYSFDKGKVISTMQGGALVSAGGDWARELAGAAESLAPPRAADTLACAARLPPYALFLRPRAYAIVRRLPGLGLGETRYDLDYPITRMSAVLAGVASRQLARLEEFTATREANAAALREALSGVRKVSLVRPPAGARPAYPRLPMLATTRGLRDRIVARLTREGIGATAFYPNALVDVPEVVRRMPRSDHDFPGARAVASRLFTLPTHGWCPAGYATQVLHALEAAVDPD